MGHLGEDDMRHFRVVVAEEHRLGHVHQPSGQAERADHAGEHGPVGDAALRLVNGVYCDRGISCRPLRPVRTGSIDPRRRLQTRGQREDW